ncbi:hypothetical protein AM587_10006321 [Phytophthora nicotianae]|uniref:Uncharacterized protein n=1 Tax=Phytophthora nicotianae TaxID=4792 RepID=A0A0W8BZW1_PHYNI|nr:hypothetical protein AM587_10006321 [Phytophthora nicotianae]
MEAEDNVVGALFLQNGEDNSYNPEDFVLDLDVGGSAPHFRISVADDDGGIPGSLFACAVWNGARFIAMHFANHPKLVEGRSLVEFGAASALPSLVALHFGAKLAVMTDADVGEKDPESSEDLTETRFDVVVVAECLWLHDLVSS